MVQWKTWLSRPQVVTIVPEAVAFLVEATVLATVVVMATCILDDLHQWKVEVISVILQLWNMLELVYGMMETWGLGVTPKRKYNDVE